MSPPRLLQALRGIWEFEGQQLVLEVDQETGELMACTQEGEPVDPGPIVTGGLLVTPFRAHPIGN